MDNEALEQQRAVLSKIDLMLSDVLQLTRAEAAIALEYLQKVNNARTDG